jgi:hypothetical protein
MKESFLEHDFDPARIYRGQTKKNAKIFLDDRAIRFEGASHVPDPRGAAGCDSLEPYYRLLLAESHLTRRLFGGDAG